MNCVNFLYSSESDFVALLKAEELSADKEYFIRIHTCIHNRHNIMPFVKMILSYLPKAQIIGSSTSGVIFEGDIMTDKCVISITEFRSASFRTCLIGLSNGELGDHRGSVIADKVIEAVVTPESRYMLAFFARPFIKINSFVERFNERCGEIDLIGGVANTAENDTVNIAMDAFVFNNSEVSNNSVAAAVIDSKNLSVYSDLIFVTEPVGLIHTITEADGMIIREIDGKNAIEWYKEQLGIDFSDKANYDMTVLFPLVRSDYDEMPWAVSYSPQNEKICVFPDEPDPVMFVPSEAKPGEKIRISYSSIQKTIDVCEKVCNNISSHPAEVLFGYSCVSRQTLFSNCAKWELMPFAKTNLTGALVVGEIGNVNKANRYCNYSFAVAALSESERRVNINSDILHDNIGELVNNQEHIVKYLVNVSKASEKRDESSMYQNQIEEVLLKADEFGIGNIMKLSFDLSMGKADKLCMLTIRNEGLLNAFMSKSKLDVHLRHFYKAIIDFINNKDYSFYIYKRTSFIITGSPSVCDGEFVEEMRSLQNYLSEYRFAEYILVSEFSIVMHEEEMLKKAELTLVSMRSKKILFLNYTADLGLEQIHARKLKMTKIVNDAVANDRVIPYFQGIRNNSAGRIDMYESLMRIKDEDGNVYTPYYFMDIAKEYGFYPDISFQMVSKVMNYFRDRSESVTINLNISDIYNYKIVHFILKYLKNAPHPENYVFELTETEGIEDYQVISEFVEQMHQMGGKIAIDDFGSGFSNIVNIFKVKSDYIKIDGEIVKNIKNDIYAREFLEMISGWAGKHGKEIVAEFIENQEIQDIIDENGIKYSQGFLFSVPSEFPFS